RHKVVSTGTLPTKFNSASRQTEKPAPATMFPRLGDDRDNREVYDSEFAAENIKIQCEIDELVSMNHNQDESIRKLRQELTALIAEEKILQEEIDRAGFSSKFFNEFVVKRIVEGEKSSCLYEVESRLDCWKYAVKKIAVPAREETINEASREFCAIAQLDHPGIIRCYATWIEQPPKRWQRWSDKNMLKSLNSEIKHMNIGDSASIYIQMQWCDYTLERWLENNQQLSSRSLPRMKSWFHQMVSAIAYIHKKNIFHGNLKPSNILFVEEDRLKISDMRIRTNIQIEDGIESAIIQKCEPYVSPEQRLYCSKTDIFSLGIILAELCAVIPVERAEQIFCNYRLGESIDVLNHVPEAESLVAWMTNINDKERPGCEEILEHLFFKCDTHDESAQANHIAAKREILIVKRESMNKSDEKPKIEMRGESRPRVIINESSLMTSLCC
ncbi:hypothetical protein PENTCL1PPCAC_10293, partial [Pristionchus entomophagus]